MGYSTNLFSIPSIEAILKEYGMHNKELRLDVKLKKLLKENRQDMVNKLDTDYKDAVNFKEEQLVIH